jgi:hypothetical protein
MKKILAALILTLSASLSASPITILDTYVGGDDQGYGDVIGDVNKFGIDSMTVDLVGTSLTVTINTLFGDNGLGSFSGYTVSGNGIGFGDLFLSSTGWDPYGASPYSSDDSSNGTIWDYGISLADRWNKSSTASLYSLDTSTLPTQNSDALLSEDFLTGATFRNGQEVAVNTGTASLLTNTTTFDGNTSGALTFVLDITGTDLVGASSIGLHWGMTCGNDTIEGAYNVPEPSTIVMMLLGLLFVGSMGLRRRQVIGIDSK